MAQIVRTFDVELYKTYIFTELLFKLLPKIFEKIAQACYVEQMDAFAKLFEDPSFYGRVMEEMGRAMYFNLKNGE